MPRITDESLPLISEDLSDKQITAAKAQRGNHNDGFKLLVMQCIKEQSSEEESTPMNRNKARSETQPTEM